MPRVPLPRDRPTVPEVRPLVWAYYAMPGNSCGGSLHVVLDDGNLDDHSVQFCIDNARDRGDDAGVRLGELLLKMSKTQRAKATRWIPTDGKNR